MPVKSFFEMKHASDINGDQNVEHIKATLDDNGAKFWKKKNNNPPQVKNLSRKDLNRLFETPARNESMEDIFSDMIINDKKDLFEKNFIMTDIPFVIPTKRKSNNKTSKRKSKSKKSKRKSRRRRRSLKKKKPSLFDTITGRNTI
tara:strand:+ start:1979 stop:2413 length:435 start_codon:yes stop_codon:yes gene_type:complete